MIYIMREIIIHKKEEQDPYIRIGYANRIFQYGADIRRCPLCTYYADTIRNIYRTGW